MKKLLTALLIIAVTPAVARRKRGSHPELCEIKSVAVSGNSESASLVRREIEKRTWLKLSPSADKADALLEIAETKSTRGFPTTTEQTTGQRQFDPKGQYYVERVPIIRGGRPQLRGGKCRQDVSGSFER